MEGYDAKFDPALEKRLECPICLLAQREPMQTPCGHRFCSACILRALRETGPRCPVDNTKVYVHQLFKDNFAKREVLSLNVHCSADDYGCLWQGELRDLQLHSKLCDLITIPCPNACGHSCQRSELPPHLPACPNRPAQCPGCSLQFPRTSLPDHQPHCSRISLPDSVASSLDKSGEVLKWIGHLKLKLNGQSNQVTGFLTAKVDSEESFLFTGCWCSTISLISLNSDASRIFSRMLQGPEVQPVQLHFALLSSDAKSISFQKLFKKKSDNFNAAVGLRLKPGNRRETRELTIMYLHWSEQRKRVVASIANLKNHLVRQIQTHLQDMQGSSRRHRGELRMRHQMGRVERTRMVPAHPHTHPPPHSHPHTHPHPRLHRSNQPHTYSFPPSATSNHPTHIPPHIHTHNPPPHMLNLHAPPQPTDVMPSLHQSQMVAAGNTPTILPNLLSWQMSQSLNTYPWRMQATGVPFFTFPSTPPQFIPANSYPYTFAPLPAAPFSISPMQHGASSVHMPTYTGLVVPQMTTVETAAVPLNSNQAIAATAPAAGYAMAAPPMAVPSQPVSDQELQAVAVTLGGEGNHILHVIRSHNDERSEQSLHQFPGVTQPVAAPNAPSALIPMEGPVPIPSLSTNAHQYATAFEVVPRVMQHLEHSIQSPHSTSHAAHTHHIHSQPPAAIDPIDVSSSPAPLSTSNQQAAFHQQSSHLSLPLDDSQSGWDMPGPSGLSQPSHHTHTISDSSPESSPEMSNYQSFSLANDSDMDLQSNLDISDSSELYEESSESNSSLSSDQEDSPINHVLDESNEASASALHTLADAAAILASSPGPSGLTATEEHAIPSQPVRLPVLINIPDSDSDSHLASPPSIIDLTRSPSTISPSSSSPLISSSHNAAYSYALMRAPAVATAVVATPHQTLHRHLAPHHSTGPSHRPSHPLPPPQHHLSESPAVHGDSRISAVLVPVIHQWNGVGEQQSIHGLRRYLPNEQVGVIQSQIGTEEVAHGHSLRPRTNRRSDVSSVPVPVHQQPQQQQQQPQTQQAFAVADYSNRSAPVANWHSGGSEPLVSGHPLSRTLLYPAHPHPAPLPTQTLPNRPPGDFWDTVIPSLDMTLQNSTTTES